ncbi:MAG: PH domain-containing protein [Natrialbaceae archaeon]|nr:PH domain-containing protein [Natrialbaceae archaeon]
MDQQYDWLSLEEGESIVWSGKPHRYSLVPAFIIGIPLSIILIGILIMASAWLSRENTHYVVTSEAVYLKRGILSRDVKRIGFDKVQNISFAQGLLGKQFGYGTVDISTAGSSGTEMQFRSVPDPKTVQETINKRIRESHTGSATSSDGESAADVLEDIRSELVAIREALAQSESLNE